MFDEAQSKRLQAAINEPTTHKMSETIITLIRAGACPFVYDVNHHSILDILLARSKEGKNDEIIKELIQKWNVPVNLLNGNNQTPFQVLIDALIEEKDANKFDDQLNSALLLVELGTNRHVKNKQGQTLVEFLAEKGDIYKEDIQFLLQSNLNTSSNFFTYLSSLLTNKNSSAEPHLVVKKTQ